MIYWGEYIRYFFFFWGGGGGGGGGGGCLGGGGGGGGGGGAILWEWLNGLRSYLKILRLPVQTLLGYSGFRDPILQQVFPDPLKILEMKKRYDK